MKIVAWLIGATFMQFVDGITSTGTGFTDSVGPVSFLALLSILIMLITQAAHRCFGLITYLPENVMRWVGGQGMQLGESQDSSAIQGGMSKGTGSIAQGAGGAASSSAGALGKRSAEKASSDQKDEHKKADDLSTSNSKSAGSFEEKNLS